MTTPALLQATAIVENTIVSTVWGAAGVPGGVFDTTPTDIIVSVFSMAGTGALVFTTNSQFLASVVLAAAGAGTPSFVGLTIVTGAVAAALQASGVGTLEFESADAQSPPLPEEPVLVRFITGPESGVIPVEIVEEAGPDVIDVQVERAESNYTPIFVDPTNPMRKKIRIVNG